MEIKTILAKLDEGRQYRDIDVSSFERRAEEDGEKTVTGYATTFNQPYELYRDAWNGNVYIVKEQVDPAAFSPAFLTGRLNLTRTNTDCTSVQILAALKSAGSSLKRLRAAIPPRCPLASASAKTNGSRPKNTTKKPARPPSLFFAPSLVFPNCMMLAPLASRLMTLLLFLRVITAKELLPKSSRSCLPVKRGNARNARSEF